MPFTRDIRCPYINIEFNTSWIMEFMTDREYKLIGSEKDLYIYVEELENLFMMCYIKNTQLCVYEFLCDNYDNVEHYDYTFTPIKKCYHCGVEDENDEFKMNEDEELCCDWCLENDIGEDQDLSHIQPKFRPLQKVCE